MKVILSPTLFLLKFVCPKVSSLEGTYVRLLYDFLHEVVLLLYLILFLSILYCSLSFSLHLSSLPLGTYIHFPPRVCCRHEVLVSRQFRLIFLMTKSFYFTCLIHFIDLQKSPLSPLKIFQPMTTHAFLYF